MQTVTEQTATIKSAPVLFAWTDGDEQADLFTVEDLEKLKIDPRLRYELIKGEIIVSTAPQYIHQAIVFRISGEFYGYLKQNPIGEGAPAPGVIFSQFDKAIPDFVYLSFERKNEILQNYKLRGAPELVVEVVSPGKVNSRRDRVQKLELYDEFAVSEYWIVDLRQANVEIYRRVNDKLQLVETVGRGQNLTTPLLPDFQISINDLFSN